MIKELRELDNNFGFELGQKFHWPPVKKIKLKLTFRALALRSEEDG